MYLLSANQTSGAPSVARSRTLLPTMSVPIPFPDPARDEAMRSWRSRDRLRAGVPTAAAALAVAAGTAALGVPAGLIWAAVAPRPLLVMTSPGAAALVNTETSAFIAADLVFCLVCLAGGVVSGALGYLFAVRRYGPLAMAGLLAGSVAAAFVARWVGEQSGFAALQHLLATRPVYEAGSPGRRVAGVADVRRRCRPGLTSSSRPPATTAAASGQQASALVARSVSES